MLLPHEKDWPTLEILWRKEVMTKYLNILPNFNDFMQIIYHCLNLNVVRMLKTFN